MALTARQKRFVEAYAGNAAAAARAAGYSARTADRQGSRLLRKAEVLEAVLVRSEPERAEFVASREERQRFWTAVMRDPAMDLGIRLRASELLARSEGDFIERRHHAPSSVSLSILVAGAYAESTAITAATPPAPVDEVAPDGPAAQAGSVTCHPGCQVPAQLDADKPRRPAGRQGANELPLAVAM